MKGIDRCRGLTGKRHVFIKGIHNYELGGLELLLKSVLDSSFVIRKKFRIEIRLLEMTDYVVYISFFREPGIEYFLFHTNAKGVDSQEFFGGFMIGNGDALGIIFMFPMKMLFIRRAVSFTEHPAVGLIFDI